MSAKGNVHLVLTPAEFAVLVQVVGREGKLPAPDVETAKERVAIRRKVRSLAWKMGVLN